VHQREHPQGEQAHDEYDGRGEPHGDSNAQYRKQPQDREDRQCRQNLEKPFGVAGLGMLTDERPLLLLEELQWRNDGTPRNNVGQFSLDS
jgi:hypothetical protein